MNLILNALEVLIPLGIGIVLLTQAARIQRWALTLRETGDVKLFDGHVRSESYLIVTRIIGVVCIGVALLLLFVVLRG